MNNSTIYTRLLCCLYALFKTLYDDKQRFIKTLVCTDVSFYFYEREARNCFLWTNHCFSVSFSSGEYPARFPAIDR